MTSTPEHPAFWPDRTTIVVEPGTLDDVPVVEMMNLLSKHGLELVNRNSYLLLRRQEGAG